MGVLRHLVMQEIVSVRSLLTPRWSCPETPHRGRCHSSSAQCLTEIHAVRGANYECGDSQHASLARQSPRILRSICHRRPQSSWTPVSKSELTNSTHRD